jgi:hypothetical protein
MSEKMPKIVRRFTNLLWVNLREDWKIKFLFHKQVLYVSVSFSDKKLVHEVRRQYKLETIKKRSKDLFGLASDCSDEIKNCVFGKNKDGNRKK